MLGFAIANAAFKLDMLGSNRKSKQKKRNANFDGNVVIAKLCYSVAFDGLGPLTLAQIDRWQVGKSTRNLCIKWCVCAVCSPCTYNMCESCVDSGFVFRGSEAESAIWKWYRMVFDIGRSVVEPRDSGEDDRKGLEAHTHTQTHYCCVCVFTNVCVCTSRIVCKLVCLLRCIGNIMATIPHLRIFY